MNALKSVVALSLAGLVSAAAHAGHYGRDDVDTYSDWARVTRVTPQYERVRDPRQECHTDYVGPERRYHSADERSYGGAVIGGIAGGILGNQVGEGPGKTAATAVGAVVGAVVGDRIDNGSGGYREARYGGQEVERCRVVDDWDNRLSGYEVEYEYNGRRYTRLMTEAPGRRIKVRVSVDPQ